MTSLRTQTSRSRKPATVLPVKKQLELLSIGKKHSRNKPKDVCIRGHKFSEVGIVYPLKNGTYTRRCNTCSNYRNNKYRVSPIGKATIRAYEHRYNEGYLRKLLKRDYGIALEDYYGLIEAQDNRCAICGKQPTGPSHPTDKLLIDHDHITGKVRGLLCNKCNWALGHLKDDPDLIRRALHYLNFQLDEVSIGQH